MLARVPSLPPSFRVEANDGRSLPLAASQFDVATCAYVLHILTPSDRDVLLAEAHRVLRRGGRIVTVTPWLQPGTAAARAWNLVDRVARRWPDRLGGLQRYDPRLDLRDAGFTVTSARTIRGGYPSLLVLAHRVG